MAEKKKKEFDLGFGEVFKGFGNFIDLLANLVEQEGEVKREGEFTAPGGLKGVYGFSIRTSIGGVPVVERFGNVKESEAGPVVDEVREPLVDVFDEDGYILVVAELPGVGKNDITVRVQGDMLELSARRGDRRYAKEVLLPSTVDASSLKQTYQNGVLEVRFAKVKEA